MYRIKVLSLYLHHTVKNESMAVTRIKQSSMAERI